jgi:hypothetical protein
MRGGAATSAAATHLDSPVASFERIWPSELRDHEATVNSDPVLSGLIAKFLRHRTGHRHFLHADRDKRRHVEILGPEIDRSSVGTHEVLGHLLERRRAKGAHIDASGAEQDELGTCELLPVVTAMRVLPRGRAPL